MQPRAFLSSCHFSGDAVKSEYQNSQSKGCVRVAEQSNVVNLLQNRLYPTYQLYAQMANGKTAPMDGLKLGAIISMRWLCRRLGEHVPKELEALPETEAYREVDPTALKSVHINHGYVVDIVSLPRLGTWSLQITEPDLGSAPGKSEQGRAAVPGRIIETNVAFHVSGKALECGFKTVISDPEGTEQEAEVYRLAIIRELLRHPDFGLKHVVNLEERSTKVGSASQVKALLSVWRDSQNQMPCVVFTEPSNPAKQALPVLTAPGKDKFPVSIQRPLSIQPSFYPSVAVSSIPKDAVASRMPTYDEDRIAKSLVAFAHTYSLTSDAEAKFKLLADMKFTSGDIIILEPFAFGGAKSLIPYKGSGPQLETNVELLKERVMTYPRGKAVSYGNIAFLSAARENLMRHLDDVSQQVGGVSEEWSQTVQQLRAESKAELEKLDCENESLREQLSRLRDYQTRLEQEKEELRETHKDEILVLREQIKDKDETIAFLRRKLGQPKEHKNIGSWVEENFGERLILHDKAIALLKEKSAQSVSVGLICDALDFLATDYWERRYSDISTEEMNSRCSEKYGRPFEVTRIGVTTIEFTPVQYKIKYFKGAKGRLVESALDYHLKVGNDPENLLRIYFLHDDDKKKIVVGSLPKHLRAVTIN